MAITNTSYAGTGNLRIAAALSQLIQESLSDKTDLRAAAKYHGSVNGSGSLAKKVSLASHNQVMVSTAETGGAADYDITGVAAYTQISTGAATLTVARQALKRLVSDQFQLSGAPQLQEFADGMADAAKQRFADMICALFTSVTASAGTASVPLTVDTVYDALNTLRSAGSNLEGPFHLVLDHTQYGQFVESLRGEGQSVHPANSADMLALRPAGLQGEWNGVMIWATEAVSGSIGCLFDSAAFGWIDGLPPMAGPAAQGQVVDGNVFVEFARDANLASDIVVGNLYVGVGIVENARAVKILS